MVDSLVDLCVCVCVCVCVCASSGTKDAHVFDLVIAHMQLISLTACMCALSGNEYVNPGYSMSLFYFHSELAVKRQRLDPKSKISQPSLNRNELMTDAPNFQRLLKTYDTYKGGNLFKTLIAIGPKGCGKTTCLELFLKTMKEKGEGDGCFFVDVAEVNEPLDLCLDPDRVHTLIIDNVQLHGGKKFPIPREIFVVVASSQVETLQVR